MRRVLLGAILAVGIAAPSSLAGTSFAADAAPAPAASAASASGAEAAANNVDARWSTAPISMGSFAGDIAMSPDGKRAYVAVADGIGVIETASGKLVETFSSAAPGTGLGRIAVSPDGKRLYVADPGGIRIVDAFTGQLTENVELDRDNYPLTLAISPDGHKLYVNASSLSGPSAVITVDTKTNQVSARTSLAPLGVRDLSQISVSPDGSRVYINGGYGGVGVVDTSTNTLPVIPSVLPTFDGGGGIQVSPDGRHLYTYGNSEMGSDRIQVIDTASEKVTAAIDTPSYVSNMVLSPDGKALFAVTVRGEVLEINTGDNSVLETLETGPTFQSDAGMAVTPDGKHVYVFNYGVDERRVTAFTRQ